MAKNDDLTFLVVDDQETILTFVTRLLNKLGYKNVLQARNGIEALKKMEEQASYVMKKPVNFVITDWEMPHMTRIEILRALRNDRQY